MKVSKISIEVEGVSKTECLCCIEPDAALSRPEPGKRVVQIAGRIEVK
jgi:hypothetical protein